MKIKLIFLLASIAVLNVWSQQTATIPLVDGSIAAGEYRLSQEKNDIYVGAWLSADKETLHLSVSAATSGWIAIGVGSSKMDGAFMVLGYVDAGKPFITYEQGKGHGHSTVSVSKVSSAISEAGDKTVLEVSLPASQYISNSELKVISAFGTKDDAKSRHAKRAVYDFKF